MPKIILTMLFLILAIATISAETVYLKDGTILKGSIKEATNETITLVTKQGDLIIQKNDIDNIDYEEPNDEPQAIDLQESQIVFDQSLFTNPLSTLLSALLFDTIDINIGSSWALSKYFIIEFIDYIDFFLSTGVFATEMQIAAYINPLGKYLNGPYLGIVGAFTSFSTYLLPSAFSAMAKVGFQWVLKSRIFLGSYLGYAYTFSPYSFGSFKYGVQIGYAFNYKNMMKSLFPNRK